MFDTSECGSTIPLGIISRIGVVGSRVKAGSHNNTNVEVNVSGGSIGGFFEANSGSTVNIFGYVVRIGCIDRNGIKLGKMTSGCGCPQVLLNKSF